MPRIAAITLSPVLLLLACSSDGLSRPAPDDLSVAAVEPADLAARRESEHR